MPSLKRRFYQVKAKSLGTTSLKEYRLYRCIARYGYRDIHKDDIEFERDLICSIAEFIRSDASEYGLGFGSFEEDTKMTVVGTSASNLEGSIRMTEDDDQQDSQMEEGPSELMEVKSSPEKVRKRVRFVVPDSPQIDLDARGKGAFANSLISF